MKVPFDKRSIRIVTVSVGFAVLSLTLARFAYPGHNDVFNVVQSIVTTVYLGYMGWYVGYDWGNEIAQKWEEVSK